MDRMLDLIQGWLDGKAPPPPVAAFIGFTLASVEPGRAVIEFEADARHTNPMGTLHGGILCDIADAAMSVAHATTLAEGESFTTLELKINFLRPVRKATLRAMAEMVSSGRTMGLARCHVKDENDRLVAHATATLMTLRGEQAEGR
jgi:uncharacterized protein (TIGR00369 family)